MSLVQIFSERCSNINSPIASTKIQASLKQAYIIDCIESSMGQCAIKELTHLTADVEFDKHDLPGYKNGLYFFDKARDIVVISDGLITAGFSAKRNKAVASNQQLVINRSVRSNYMDENGNFIGRNARNYIHLHLDDESKQFIYTKDNTLQCLSYTIALYLWDVKARETVKAALLDETKSPWTLVVNHKNNDCRDNDVFRNLELCEQWQNQIHGAIVEMIWSRDDLQHLRGAGYVVKDNNKSTYKHDLNFYLSVEDALKVGNTTAVMLNEFKRISDELHPVSKYSKNLKALTAKLVNAYKLPVADAAQAARVLLANITANYKDYVPEDFVLGDEEAAKEQVMNSIVLIAFNEFSKGLEAEALAYTE